MDPYEHASRPKHVSYPPVRQQCAVSAAEQHQCQDQPSAYWLQHQQPYASPPLHASPPLPTPNPPTYSEPLYVQSSILSASTPEITQMTPSMKYEMFSFDPQVHHSSSDRHMNRLVQPSFTTYEASSAGTTPLYAVSAAEVPRNRLDEVFQDPKGVMFDRMPSSPESAQSSSGKRRAQNREAQRAFRARKQQHVKDIERQLSDLREKYRQLQDSHDELQGTYENLRRAVGLNAQEDIESRIATLKKLLEAVDAEQWPNRN